MAGLHKLAIPRVDNVKAITELLDDSPEFRREVREFLASDPAFALEPDELEKSVQDQRHRTFKRLTKFINRGFISVRDITQNTLRFIAAHEEISFTDPAVVYLFSVHFNLFGGSVLKLGTEKHHKEYLHKIDSLETPGCFALTEFTHGVNSGFNCDTTATYDATTQEFIIHTPHPGAQKTWISFMADYARVAVVFAQLMLNGETQGVHAFVMPIRDAQGKPIPGVNILDLGHKPAVNGNDNGRIFFEHVRIPRDALLDRYCEVSADGKYTPKIEKLRDRFLKVSDQLISGRMCIASCAVVSCKMALLGAVRYSIGRIQRRWDGESSLYQHLSQRRALLNGVARTYGMQLAVNYVKDRYAKTTAADHEEVITLVCAIKAAATLFNVEVTSTAREKTGGQGLLSVNRLGELNNTAASLVVVEGDSMILAQKTAKDLLDRARKGGNVRMLVTATAKTLAFNARIALANVTAGVTDPSFHNLLLEARQHMLTIDLAMALHNARQRGISMLEAWSKQHLGTALHLHRAFVERLAHRKFTEAVEKCADPSARKLLQALLSLHALLLIEADLAWFLTHTAMSSGTARAVNAAVIHLLRLFEEQDAEALVAGFGFPEKLLFVPLTRPIGEGAWRKAWDWY